MPGWPSMMRRVASMPLMPGMLMSISTSAGARASTSSTASSPRPGLAHRVEARRRRQHGTGGAPERRLVVDDQHGRRAPQARRRSSAALSRPSAGSTRVPAPPRRGGVSPPRSARYSSTALTRRCTSGSSVRPSFEKIELMCFSTARSVRTSAAAMAALFLPWAISARISRSRGVRRATGDSAPRARPATSASTTLGSITDPPSATSRMAPTQLVEVGHPLLQQVGPPLGAVLEEREGVGRLGVLAEHHHARAGDGCARISAAARMPSSVPVGGMRMSVSTTSGWCSATAASSES